MPKNETEARQIAIQIRDAWNHGRESASNPDATNPYDAMVEAYGEEEIGVCVHCGRETIMDGGKPTHRGDEGGTYRGCRAASYTSERGWDETIDRNQVARNARKV